MFDANQQGNQESSSNYQKKIKQSNSQDFDQINLEAEPIRNKEMHNIDPKVFKADDIDLLGYNLSRFSRSTQFIILTIATFFFYLIYGYMLEHIFRLPRLNEFAWYFTLIQFIIYVIFALMESNLRTDTHRKMPLQSYLFLAFLTVATMGLSNAAVVYLNYPTQVMFKSCKLIPVLIGGILIQGKRYNLFDVSATICMSIGLIFFTLADQKVQPTFNPLGVILICGALVADAVIGNVQEKQMKTYKASNVEVVLYSYGLGSLYLLFYVICFDNFLGAASYWNENKMMTYGNTMILSITGYLGINVVLNLVKYFGALLAVTVTTSRKAVTIVLSFILFTKPFTWQYLWSGLLVLIGIYLNVLSKNQDSILQKFRLYLRQSFVFMSTMICGRNIQTEIV